ncbi:antiviral innate immune response receptor RIG-I-like [Haliotis rubra]|uniref:antiviral innate immune response receptor RIG-I-like n=1 Tax=Haliotis rubra TaxID=36100 RepID=UPI001EE626A4|nr:antiviral innate immune response receptor RIG-I-like [Haliotis rubra]
MSTGTGSTCEDNTLWDGFDMDDLTVTLEMSTERDKIQRLENRPYQDELVRSAAGGGNFVIVAPTGCGKMVVALRIIQEHLTKMKDKGLPSKIKFFANEVTLVDQQHELCQGHLDSKYKSTKIVGETKYKTPVSTKELIAQSDLLVMTPQIIVDALEKKTLESLSVFSLVIFDECHHIREKHPTNKIMSHYMEMKQSSAGNVQLPQVVGLTASVGVGKMKESEGTGGALKHIIHLCANMDAKGGIVTVREHKDSLAEYANHVESAIEVAKERISDPFKDCIVKCIMEPIEEEIIEKHRKSEDQLTHIKDIVSCQAKGTSWYTQWLDKLYSDKFLQIKRTCVNHLRVYNQALALNMDCRTHDAMNYILSQMNTICPAKQFRTPTDEKLYSLYTDNLEKLKAESAPDINVNPNLRRASRVPDGTYVTLTSKDDLRRKEESNMRLETVMDEAISMLQEQIQKDPLAFRQQIENFQKENKVSRETERIQTAEQPSTDDAISLQRLTRDIRINWRRKTAYRDIIDGN